MARTCRPSALKPNCVIATLPSASVRKMGPLSRIQASSMGISATSTSPQASMTSSRRPGLAMTVTGSKRAISLMTRAHSRLDSSKWPIDSRAGHETSVRSCSTQRMGMVSPSASGVVWVVCGVASVLIASPSF